MAPVIDVHLQRLRHQRATSTPTFGCKNDFTATGFDFTESNDSAGSDLAPDSPEISDNISLITT